MLYPDPRGARRDPDACPHRRQRVVAGARDPEPYMVEPDADGLEPECDEDIEGSA
jgi:hypothetical protein